jgi:hypothetical protein
MNDQKEHDKADHVRIVLLFSCMPAVNRMSAFSLSELAMTETELTLIAAAAIIGFNSRPKNG